MRDFKDPYYTGEPCKCCTPKPEDIDAHIDALLERIELVGIELKVLGEQIDDLGDRLTLLQREINDTP
jgi:hypothetical protein